MEKNKTDFRGFCGNRIWLYFWVLELNRNHTLECFLNNIKLSNKITEKRKLIQKIDYTEDLFGGFLKLPENLIFI